MLLHTGLARGELNQTSKVGVICPRVWSGFFLTGRPTFLVLFNATFGNKKRGNCFSETSFVAEALCPADTVSKVLSEGLHHLWISWLRDFLLFSFPL